MISINSDAKELRQAGASDSEVNELLPLISNLKKIEVRNNRKYSKLFIPAFAAVLGVIFSAIFILLSETALPGSSLFPIQKLADSTLSTIDPSYRMNLMMKRANQVNRLVSANSPIQADITAIKEYNSAANKYILSSSKSYDAIKYCKANLVEASNKAPNEVKQQLIKSINGIDES